MTLICTKSQKDSIAKFFWDMAKINFGALIIGPLARGEEFRLQSVVPGVVAGLLLCLDGYLFGGMEIEQLTTVEIIFFVFGFLALAGIVVALTDKSLKWKGRK